MRTRVNIYEDSIRYHNEMIQMAAIKDSMANSLFKEANEIKKKINQKKIDNDHLVQAHPSFRQD